MNGGTDWDGTEAATVIARRLVQDCGERSQDRRRGSRGLGPRYQFFLDRIGDVADFLHRCLERFRGNVERCVPILDLIILTQVDLLRCWGPLFVLSSAMPLLPGDQK